MKGHLPYKADVSDPRCRSGFLSLVSRLRGLCVGATTGGVPAFLAMTTKSICRHCQPNVPWGTKLPPVENRWSRCSSWHTARDVLHNDTCCHFSPSQPEVPEDRVVHRCLDKQVGGEVDGAERQLDRPADGQMGVFDSGSRSDEKNPKIHSDWGEGFQSRMF